MLLVTVKRDATGEYRAWYGGWRDGRGWDLGNTADKAHSALCRMDAKVIYCEGLVEGLYAIRAESLPGYDDK